METDNDEYFCSYEDLESHQIMLNDVARQEAYKKAILGNSELFQVPNARIKMFYELTSTFIIFREK